MAWKIIKLEKLNDNVSKDRCSINFSGSKYPSATFHTSSGTYFLSWNGVIGTMNGCYLDGKHISEIYNEYI